MNNESTLEHIRHSLAHLLAAAVLKEFPDAKLGIGPTIEHGFYYDFLLPRPLTLDDLKTFEKEMRRLVNTKLPIAGKEITLAEAEQLFVDQPFKQELARDFSKDAKTLTVYSTGEVFTDLCKGGHVENTSEIKADAFKLTTIAGAYWKGSEKNQQLQRIYGLAFETKEDLAEHFRVLEEAKKRDHKKLGPELDLFTFSDLVGSGLPLWTPKGTLLRNLLDEAVTNLRKEHGYEYVEIPHITKKDLYEKSGHWEKFQNELFHIMTREGHEFVMKPMNCPHHTQIYNRKQWSYRELPQRYANTTMCYRDEQSGELAGLSRVRSITQDDAHVFCRKSQFKDEMNKVWDIIERFYSKFGFKLRVRISLSDPAAPENYLGSKEVWQEAEQAIRELAESHGLETSDGVGEAAFYGPKLDFLTKDSLGREWQIATIQLDMNMPERFDLFCINEEGEKERIVMIHAAIMGSLERFISVLIEDSAGALPFWCSPVQVKVLTINEKNKSYIDTTVKALKTAGIRYEIDERNESIGKKIREAEIQKTPFVLIIGDKEAESNVVALRARGKGDLGQVSLDEAIKTMHS